jgi:hypothetical protein
MNTMPVTTVETTEGRYMALRKNPRKRIFWLRVIAKARARAMRRGTVAALKEIVFFKDFRNTSSRKI